MSNASTPPILRFTVGASVTGGLIGAWEAALVLIFDPELTTSRGGALELVFIAAAIGAVLAAVAAVAFALLRRVRPGQAVFGARTSGVTFALALAALFYGGYYLNEAVLPGKAHPLSLLVDLALLAVCWLAIRFIPPIRLGRISRSTVPAVVIFGAITTAALVSGSTYRLGPPEAQAPPGARNLLLITMDTTRADRLGAYGGPAGLTPNLDELAAAGEVYRRAYCPMPLTGPSHASLLTGRTPRELGVVQNGVTLPEEVPTLAETLRARGYRTGAVVAAFPVSSKLGFARGFEFYDDAFSTGRAASRLTIARLAGGLGLINVKARLQRPGNEVTAPALEWLHGEENRPFFLWVHYFDPHTPYEPPPEYLHKTRAHDPHVQAYDGEVAFMDNEIGKLLAALDDTGERDNTVIVAVADHGESLGEHDYYYDHGRYVYEPCMHVPLIVAAPPAFPRAGEAAWTVPFVSTSLHDFLLAGLFGETTTDWPNVPPDAPIYGESLEAGVNYRMVVKRPPGRGPLSKLIFGPGADATELYNLEADPAETADLSERNRELVRELRLLLDGHFNAQPPLPAESAADDDTKEKLKSLGYVQ